jgi:hypothetical protein
MQCLQSFVISARIDGGRRNVGMSKQMLDIVQVEAATKQMGSECMTQGLWADGSVDSGRAGGDTDDFPHTHA